MTNVGDNGILHKGLVCANLEEKAVISMNLTSAVEGREYIIRSIDTDDEELNAFLFSLGCYSGEPITVVSHLKKSCVVSIKDARYNIDRDLAAAMIV